MAVPEAVRKQAEEADRAMEAMEKENEVRETVVETPAPETVVATPAPHDEPEVTKNDSVSLDEYNRVKLELDHASQALRTLQGKYTAEVPRMAEEMRNLKQQFAELSRAPALPAEPQKPAYLRHVKDEEVQDIDKSLLDMQGRMAQGVAEAEVAKIRDETQRFKNDMSAQVAELKKHMTDGKTKLVWAEVEKVHPGASLMDTQGDPKWVAFLNTIDRKTKRSNMDLGAEALALGNSDGVIALLDEFKVVSGTPSVSPVIQGQVKPRTAGVEQARNSSQKPVYKESQMNALVSEITRGLWKNRKEEAQAKMDLFEEAVLENRILFGQ
jgi:hypothetical protein